MRRLRVAFVAHSVDPRRGGMELVNARLLERLAAVVDLEVVAGDGLETTPATVRRTHLPIPSRPSVARLVVFDLLATVRLRAVRRRVDLVHSCGAVAHCPVDLVTVHLSHAAVIDAQGTARPPGRGGIGGAVSWARRRRAARLERWTMRPDRVRRVAAISAADERDLAARYPALSVSLVENGVDLARFESVGRADPPASAPLRAVVVAGDFERKGVALAIAAVAASHRSTLRIVGDGDLAVMRALADAAGVADRVTLVGHRSAVEAEYASADVVLSCSAHESFGLSMVEGAAVRCAVVCTATGIGPELCADDGDGPGGIVVAANPAAIAAALDLLDADRATCRAMGEVAARRAQRFSWDQMASSTLAIYEELAAGVAR